MERIAIIGGGIAGLSAGIYAARNGVDRPVVPVDELFTLRHPGGTALPVCADVDELARRMRAIAPYDARAVDRLVADIKLFARFIRYRFTSARSYARRFRDRSSPRRR